MRRLFLLTLTLLLVFSTACAEEFFKFVHPAEAGLTERDVNIAFQRVKSGHGDGVLLLLDEAGNLLGQKKIARTTKDGTIRFSVTKDMPAAQTIQLVLQRGDEQLLQDSCLFAVDDRIDGVRKVATEKKKIAITFDSASGLGKLPDLLDLLDKVGAKCTFFLQGEIIPKHTDWVTEIYARGHELANHSMHHPDMREITNSRIYKEVTRCNDLITEITGQETVLYRPPSGYYSYRDRAIGRALGSEMILWTFDSKDGFTDSSRARIWNIMTTHSEPGAIILMHIYGRHTLSILEEYVPMMREQGYEFVTVTDLMTPAGTLDSDGTWHPAAPVQ